ncbi:EI24 domain-containing protein [Streptomyces albidoflavus]|uniref:EI24 domain-containing protein n=1 Tax=Streptomyces albidoflavus TaxID=1886 RepID=UPI00386B989F|nr:EI24 domain-containing protein [Streptomyces albidoflavus]
MGDLGVGFRYLMNGQRWALSHGKTFGLGLLPGLITLVVYAAALVALAFGADDLIAWATPFADGWGSPWLGLFRGFLTAVLFALGLMLAVITFTSVTLLVGSPFYDAVSERVDASIDGNVPTSGRSFWYDLWASTRDSLRILVRAAIWGVLLFALGFIPVVGQTAIPVAGFFVTGFFLTEELASVALARRDVDLRGRLTLLRSRRMLAWGFGVPLALAYVIPFVAVFLMPGAVAGATLLSRDLLGEPTAPTADAVPGTGEAAPAGLAKPPADTPAER